MKTITARLLDKDGYTITEFEYETQKDAKARCKYWLSDDYARSAETTHTALGTDKAEVKVNGEVVWDCFK